MSDKQLSFLCILILMLKSLERITGCNTEACGSGSETDLYWIKRIWEPDNTLIQRFSYSNPVDFVPKWKLWNYNRVLKGYSLQDFQSLSNLTLNLAQLCSEVTRHCITQGPWVLPELFFNSVILLCIRGSELQFVLVRS